MPAAAEIVRIAWSACGRLPLPVPSSAPARYRSIASRSIAASAIACLPAAIANCEKRAMRRASLRSIHSLGSKSWTWPATLQG